MFMVLLLLSGLILLVVMGWVSYRFGTVWHPLLWPCGTLSVMAVAAPLLQQIVLGERQYPQYQIQASLLTTLYLLCLSLPFVWDLNLPGRVFSRILKPFEISVQPQIRGGYQYICLLLLGGGGCLYLMLIGSSPAAWDWILRSREAYQFGRSGVGHWYVLSQGLLMFSYLVWLFFCDVKSWKRLIPVTILYAAAFQFYGSKQGIVGVLIVGCVYSDYFIRRMRLRTILAIGGCLVPLVVLSPWLQGNYSNLKQTLGYYDYFDNSALYLEKFSTIQLRWGGAFLSSFWEYVPRGLSPSKPYVYGQLLINEALWPGMTAKGHTPALLPWVVSHLDFGIVGVVLGGLIQGVLMRGIYDYFLRSRSFLGFIILLQVCFTPVLKHTPLLYFMAAMACVSGALNLGGTGLSILRPVAGPEATGDNGDSPRKSEDRKGPATAPA